MSRSPGSVRFVGVSKHYKLGYRRAYLREALPWVGTGNRGFTALDDVSFSVSPGDSFALLGHNGAGKSTALKCLAGVTRPTAGSVEVEGRVSALIELGAGFHPDLTGRENARFTAALAGVGRKQITAAIDEAVEFSEIGQFLDTPVKRYSSGMIARLAFGLAVALPGEVLVVDEVLAVGDVSFQRKCHSKLRELRSKGNRTLILVSHNEWVVKETCSRAVVLNKGRVAFLGDTQDGLKHYLALQATERGRNQSDASGESRLISLRSVSLIPLGESQFAADQSVVLRAEIDVAPEAKSPVLGVCLLNGLGQLIWAVYSHESGLAISPGPHQVVVELERLHALPGPCQMQVFTFDRAHPLVEDVKSLEIEVLGAEWRTGVEWGLVHQEATMRILSEGCKEGPNS